MILESEAKYCSTCHTVKPISEFSKRADKPHLCRSKCKQCTRDYANNRNADPKVRAERIAINEAKRELTRKYVYDYLSTHPCVDCGEDNWVVLEFDHVRGDKWKNVCDIMAKSLQEVIDEIAKCESVCANCHKIRSYTRAGTWRINYGSPVEMGDPGSPTGRL